MAWATWQSLNKGERATPSYFSDLFIGVPIHIYDSMLAQWFGSVESGSQGSCDHLWEAHHHSQRTYNSLQSCHYLGPLIFSTTCGERKTRCSPRTRTLTRSHTYVNEWYKCRNKWICSHAEHLSAIVYLNSLVHVSPVTSQQSGVESVECGV